MRIAIVEICEKNHYMVSEGLIRTYQCDEANDVVVWTNPEIFSLLNQENYIRNVRFEICTPDQSVRQFLTQLSAEGFDRIHWSTVSKYYADFEAMLVDERTEFFFHFHNVDLWFSRILLTKWKSILEVVRSNAPKSQILNYMKWTMKEIYLQRARRRLMNRVQKVNSFFVGLSEVQRGLLGTYLPLNRIIIFPSLVRIPGNQQAVQSSKILVNIPGGVSQFRRDYVGFLESVRRHASFYAKHITIEMLGVLKPEEVAISSLIMELRKAGVEILTYSGFLEPTDYDARLARADILLSNIKVHHSADGKGQLKETGTVYNIVRGAKPALFPSDFILDPEFGEVVVSYSGYDDLRSKLESLVTGSELLQRLQVSARSLASTYEPESLLPRLKVGRYSD